MAQTNQKRIEQILRDFPETRNSDIALMIAYWKKHCPRMIKRTQDGREAVLLTDLYDLPREDSIKRTRAKLNAKGLFYPTDKKVFMARRLNEDKWREENGYPAHGEAKESSKSPSYTQGPYENSK